MVPGIVGTECLIRAFEILSNLQNRNGPRFTVSKTAHKISMENGLPDLYDRFYTFWENFEASL